MNKRLAAWLHSDRVPMALSILVMAFAVLIVSARLPLLYDLQQRIEALAYDARMRFTLPARAEFDPQVVIVDIDERSLAAEGHWPWPRGKIAALVDGIAAAGAAAVAFDSTYPEADRNAAAELLADAGERLEAPVRAAIEAEREAMDQDRVLAQSLAATTSVLGFTFTRADEQDKGELPPSTVRFDGDLDRAAFIRMPAHVGNLPVLQQGATAGGFFTVLPDFDGVIRRVPTVLRRGDQLYASLALEAIRLTFGAESVDVITRTVGDERRVERISIGGMLDIPTDGQGQVIVPYRGPSPGFLYIPATDVLKGTVAPGVMEGSVVLVGSSAEGIKDLRATPVQAVYPGVEIHATVISALFGEGFPVVPNWALGADVAVIVFGGLLATFLFPRLQPLLMIGVAFLLVGAIATANIWLWSTHKLVLSLATPVLVLVTITFIHVNFRFLAEARSRRNLRDSFGQYVPATLVEEMYQDPDKDFGFEGESREMSVLFSDIRGFTTLSEALDPHALKQFLNAWFTPVTEIIFGHHGTIDKYVGDMVMAFWGAPMRDAEHRRNALEAAFDVLDALPRMQQEFAARGWPHIDVGIGINSGHMNVGDMGSSFRRAYTVLGDSVNLGSRLEGLTKVYGVKLIAGEDTVRGVSGFVFRHLDRARVKGKAEPIDLYEPLCREEQADESMRAELVAHHAALARYFAGDWDAAAREFSALSASYPARGCYAVYLERIGELRVRFAAGGWDGVYDHTSK